MSSGTYTLSKKDFHAYIDGQLTEPQYEKIEKRLDESPHIIRELQNCLLINERIQSCFGGLDETKEEVNDEIDVEFANMGDAMVSLEDLETILPGSDELDEKFFKNLKSTEDDTAINLTRSNTLRPPPSQPKVAMDKIDNENLPELALEPTDTILPSTNPELNFGAKRSRSSDTAASHETATPPVLTNSAYSPKKKAETSVTNSEDIDVDNFLKGINETHMVDHTHQLTRQSLRKDIFSPSSATSAISIFIKNLVIRMNNGLRHKINSRRTNSSDGESANDIIFDANTDIEIPELGDEHMVGAVGGQLQPYTHSLPTWINRLNHSFETFSKVSIIAKALKQKYWILVSLTVGLLLGNLLFSEATNTGHGELEALATDSHLYYVEQGRNAIDAGMDDFEANMQWLDQYWGKQVKVFDISAGTQFRRKGAILIPSISGYASVQTFQNINNEQLTLFVSRLDDASEDSHIRCHTSEKVAGLCSWNKDSLAYFVIGDITLSRIRLFSTLIASQT
ncbi:MAG: hypothetical protein ACC707_14340 [Thiohalomonadales bacterium]